MEAYLEKLCVFICLGDLLGHFLPSPGYEKLYRYLFGTLVLLMMLKPLGEGVTEAAQTETADVWEAFSDRLSGQSGLWDADGANEALQEETERMLEGYLGRISEEEMEEELSERGYANPEEEE